MLLNEIGVYLLILLAKIHLDLALYRQILLIIHQEQQIVVFEAFITQKELIFCFMFKHG